MTRVPPTSGRTQAVLAAVSALQQRFVRGLESLDAPFTPIEWFRDEGRHGGGIRFAAAETPRFNRASVNVSCVHHEDEPARPLRSATALSTIIHPQHPLLPSLHLHVSFTEPREGEGTWRLMADLNPSHENVAQTTRFASALERVVPQLAAEARAEGDRYFFIPALGRTRGVTHFYVEAFSTGDFDADLALVEGFARAGIDTYLSFLNDAPSPGPDAAQRAYHTLYFFQVLTLDRGTTSGLLAHDQNDVGVMGSLPAFIDVALLASWAERAPKPQDALVRALCAVVPGDGHVTDVVRAALAKTVRAHYRAYPEALALQAATPR